MPELPAPEIDVGLKVTVTPVGCPVAVRLIGELNPPVTELEIVDEPELPCATETEDGDALNVKPGVVTVSVTVVDAVVPPDVPVTVMV